MHVNVELSDRWKRVLLAVGVIAGMLALAWAVYATVDWGRQSAHHAAHVAVSRTMRAQEESCYVTDALLWRLDRYSYASWKRDHGAAQFLHGLSRQRGIPRRLGSIARVFAGAASDAYWQPLMDCEKLAKNPNVGLGVARPISKVKPATIRRVLKHAPKPPPPAR